MAKEFENNMLKKVVIFCFTTILGGCSVLPGLQNPDISKMQKVIVPKTEIRPVLVPITPTLIADTRISKYVYHVAPTDVLNIRVWQHPEFSTPTPTTGATLSTHGSAGEDGYLVNPDGYISFPLIGNVHVGGKTVDAIRLKIRSRLRKYVQNPQINVRVADFRGQKVYVLGEVMKPGIIPLNDQPLTITDAILMSGSIDPNAADPSHVYVFRGNYFSPRVYWLDAKTPDALLMAEHFNLQPGDVLYISSANATRWNRVLNQLLPTLQTIWYTKTISNL